MQQQRNRYEHRRMNDVYSVCAAIEPVQKREGRFMYSLKISSHAAIKPQATKGSQKA